MTFRPDLPGGNENGEPWWLIQELAPERQFIFGNRLAKLLKGDASSEQGVNLQPQGRKGAKALKEISW
jgi:hypothetical protein